MARRFTCNDIWPTPQEVDAHHRARPSTRRCSARNTRRLSKATATGSILPVPTGDIYLWDDASTYIKKPPYFDNMTDPNASDRRSSKGCACWRCWAIRSPPITSRRPDRFAVNSPAGKYLIVAGRAAKRFQLLRRAPRQPRSDGARHAGECSAAQPARAGHGRPDGPSICRTASRCSSTMHR